MQCFQCSLSILCYFVRLCVDICHCVKMRHKQKFAVFAFAILGFGRYNSVLNRNSHLVYYNNITLRQQIVIPYNVLLFFLLGLCHTVSAQEVS